MPPPDTIIILPSGDTITALIPNEGAYNSLPIQNSARKYEADPRPKEHWGEFLLVALVFTGIVWLIDKIRKGLIESRQNIERGEVTDVVEDKGYLYHDVLVKCNPYYAGLAAKGQEVFLGRVVSFMQSKEFRFHAIAEEEHIPVLISGAAVQLTFGLKNYLLDYFDIIHVMRKEYVLNIDNETYFGHVSKNGIHISWSHFLKGYSDYTDSVNVGLHEMAHALQFDAYLGYENQYDRDFKERLSSYCEEGRPVFRAMRAGLTMLLDEYALTNFDEFWAVSIESFFENPAIFKKGLPVLYNEMCQLLNQDPLLPGKIINPDLL